MASDAIIVDIRGKRVRPLADLHDPPPILPFRRADVPLARSTRRWLAVSMLLSLGGVLVLTIVVGGAVFGMQGSMRAWVAPLLLFALFAMSGLFIAAWGTTVLGRRDWNRRGRDAAAALVAAMGQCPSCGTWLLSTPQLKPTPGGRGGLTTCPTCSSTWRVGNQGGCPGCGYDMSAVPATAGPLAICPECATLSVAAGSMAPAHPCPGASNPITPD